MAGTISRKETRSVYALSLDKTELEKAHREALANIRRYERKYGVPFAEFERKKLRTLDTVQAHEDYNDWFFWVNVAARTKKLIHCGREIDHPQQENSGLSESSDSLSHFVFTSYNSSHFPTPCSTARLNTIGAVAISSSASPRLHAIVFSCAFSRPRFFPATSSPKLA
jgi:hypothetical protein